MKCHKVLLELNSERDTQTNPACRALPHQAVQQATPQGKLRGTQQSGHNSLLVTFCLYLVESLFWQLWSMKRKRMFQFKVLHIFPDLERAAWMG